MRKLVLASALVLSTATLIWAQGFDGGLTSMIGRKPETATLIRKLPPVVQVAASTMKVEAFSARSVPGDVQNIFLTKMRAEILTDHDHRIRIDNNDPQIIFRCSITGYELVERRRQAKVGNEIKRYLSVIGNMEASIEILDVKRTPLHAANLKHHYEEEFDESTGSKVTSWIPKRGERIPTPQERQSNLVEGLARKAAQAIVPIAEEIQVQLPKGKPFEEFRKLAQAGRWGPALEAAEKVPTFKDLDDESYKYYAQAVANEGLAYTQAKEVSEINDFLSRAQGLFTKAKETNRKEKKFLPNEIRVQESLDHILAIEDAKTRIAKGPKKEDASSAPSSNEYNNQYLVTLHKKGRSDKFILNEIKTVADAKFDDSPVGKNALFDAGLSEDVVMAVSTRMSEERAKRRTTPRQIAAPAPPPAATTQTPPPAARPVSGVKPRTAQKPAAVVNNTVAPAVKQ